MRHRKKNNHLGRKTAHRHATLANMASSLIIHKRINTTVAKAKALRVFVEPLITKSKLDSTHSRRVVFSYLRDKHAVSELFREISQKIAERQGGYTRILKTGFRKGDGAEMCFIELVDYNLNMLKTSEEKQQKRTRRGKSKKVEATDSQKETTTQKTDTPTEEKPKEEVKAEAETSTETVKEEVEEVKAEKDVENKDEASTEENIEDKKEEKEEKEEKTDEKNEEEKKSE